MADNTQGVTAGAVGAAASPSGPAFVFCCRRCRTPLFDDRELVRHSSDKRARGNKGFRRQDGSGHRGDEAAPADAEDPSTCTSYFLDPDITPWVAEESRSIAAVAGGEEDGGEVLPDTIYCRNARCGAKIGTQSWTGAQCSCGAWITPAFKILAKTVDKLPVDLVVEQPR